mmetsp:Transcript_13336/g.53504  ORF Transcript_13336/g.53504 Transcript_13336/m.53504 type:complete len:236 (+) Transcript_13336:442-1149(+)
MRRLERQRAARATAASGSAAGTTRSRGYVAQRPKSWFSAVSRHVDSASRSPSRRYSATRSMSAAALPPRRRWFCGAVVAKAIALFLESRGAAVSSLKTVAIVVVPPLSGGAAVSCERKRRKRARFSARRRAARDCVDSSSSSSFAATTEPSSPNEAVDGAATTSASTSSSSSSILLQDALPTEPRRRGVTRRARMGGGVSKRCACPVRTYLAWIQMRCIVSAILRFSISRATLCS